MMLRIIENVFIPLIALIEFLFYFKPCIQIKNHACFHLNINFHEGCPTIQFNRLTFLHTIAWNSSNQFKTKVEKEVSKARISNFNKYPTSKKEQLKKQKNSSSNLLDVVLSFLRMVTPSTIL